MSTSVHNFYQVSKKLFFCIISIRHTTPWLSEEPSAHAQTHIRQFAHCLYKVCRWLRGVVKRPRYRRFDFWSPFVRAPSLPSSMLRPTGGPYQNQTTTEVTLCAAYGFALRPTGGPYQNQTTTHVRRYRSWLQPIRQLVRGSSVQGFVDLQPDVCNDTTVLDSTRMPCHWTFWFSIQDGAGYAFNSIDCTFT